MSRPHTTDDLFRILRDKEDRIARLELSLVLARTIEGSVASTGAITRGTGYSVNKNGTGDYSINFTNALDTPPVVVLGLGVISASGRSVGLQSSPTTAGFRVLTFISVAADLPFEFIATAAT